MTDHVRADRGGGLLTLTLDRPERRNALTVAMYAALADAIEAAAGAEIRVIAIRGEGVDFTAGNDLGDFLQALPRDGEEVPVMRLLRALACCTIPIVAAVHGHCIGIGTTMLLHCDLVVAADDAGFSLPFVDLGLVPEAASSLLLPRLAGRRRAARYLLLGEAFGVDEAMDIGLISHRAPLSELHGVQDRIVATLLAKPPEALRLTQALLRRGQEAEVLERMGEEGECFTGRLQSEEVKQAIIAFFAARGNLT